MTTRIARLAVAALLTATLYGGGCFFAEFAGFSDAAGLVVN